MKNSAGTDKIYQMEDDFKHLVGIMEENLKFKEKEIKDEVSRWTRPNYLQDLTTQLHQMNFVHDMYITALNDVRNSIAAYGIDGGVEDIMKIWRERVVNMNDSLIKNIANLNAGRPDYEELIKIKAVSTKLKFYQDQVKKYS